MLAKPDPGILSATRTGASGKQVRLAVNAGGRDLGIQKVVVQERRDGVWTDVATSTKDPWVFQLNAGKKQRVYRAMAIDSAGVSGISDPVRVKKKRR